MKQADHRKQTDASSLVLLAYQKRAVQCAARFTWNCWARQTGKSFTFSLRCVLRGLLRRRDQIILSAGERQSREVMEKVRQHCRALKSVFAAASLSESVDVAIRGMETRLPNGARIIALPANPMTARGFTGDVFLDEFAMHRDADAIWAALLPTLLRGDGHLDVASTPLGRGNMFDRLQGNERFHRTTLTLADAISHGLEADADAMRSAINDERIWRQEFCCEFLDERSSFMPYELIRSCQDGGISTEIDARLLSRRREDIYAGVDVGRVRDATAIWLWRCAGEAYETVGVRVMHGAPFGEQEAVLAEILSLPALRRCCIDATGLGLHLAERLAERFGSHRVEGVVFTAGLKAEMAGALRVLAERGLVRIPADADIASDWHAISRATSAAGHVRYEADRSRGVHGDRFWAAALGLHAARGCGPSDAGFVSGGSLTFGRHGIW